MTVATPSSPSLSRPRPVASLLSWARTVLRPYLRHLGGAALVLLSLGPLCYIGLRIAEATRNIAYWDEYETALTLVLHLDSGTPPSALLREFFAVNNEHRMVMSRVLFALSYWTTGTVNFSVISLIGNATLLALCALLLYAASPGRRLRLGLVLAFGLFQLENYENFLWSGSSIDHFQVLLYVGATVVALARPTWKAWLVAALCALLASLTLAHGLLVWPLGAVLLALTRRSPHLTAWCAFATLVVGGYLAGFTFNSAHHFAPGSAASLVPIGHYWLTLLGTVPALGHTLVAPWCGLALLALLGWLTRSGGLIREPVLLPLAWFGVVALAVIAAGRAEQVGGAVMSRYVILASLAWSIVVFLWLERATPPGRPWFPLTWGLPLLVVFNLCANRVYAASANSWIECRDLAAAGFKQHGADGHANFSLYPHPDRSTALLRESERRGLYHLGPICQPCAWPAAQPSGRIRYEIDEFSVSDRSAFIRGWAAIPGIESGRGAVQLILRSAESTLVFTTVNTQRPDVVEALGDPRWLRSGYIFVRQRNRLPVGDYQVGFLVQTGDRAEYVMTDRRLQLRHEALPTPSD